MFSVLPDPNFVRHNHQLLRVQWIQCLGGSMQDWWPGAPGPLALFSTVLPCRAWTSRVYQLGVQPHLDLYQLCDLRHITPPLSLSLSFFIYKLV